MAKEVTIMVDVEKILALREKQGEVVKKVASGEISIEDALNGTQDILDGIYPSRIASPPSRTFFSEEPGL